MRSPFRMLQEAIIRDFLENVLSEKRKEAALQEAKMLDDESPIVCCIECLEFIYRNIPKYL